MIILKILLSSCPRDLISISLNNLADNFRRHSRGRWKKTHNKGFLPSRCSICQICDIAFLLETNMRWRGEVVEFSKLSIPFFAFKFPTWHKRSWLPAYITRPQVDNPNNVFGKTTKYYKNGNNSINRAKSRFVRCAIKQSHGQQARKSFLLLFSFSVVF